MTIYYSVSHQGHQQCNNNNYYGTSLIFLTVPDLYLTSILQEVDQGPATMYSSKTTTTNEQMECLQHALTCNYHNNNINTSYTLLYHTVDCNIQAVLYNGALW